MLLKFLRFLSGFVRFTVSGEFPERFLTQLALNGISVWGIRRRGDRIEAEVRVRDYLKFRSLRGKNRCVTRVSRRFGLPFFLKKHRLRVGMLLGPVLFVAVLVFMSSFIWNVRVVGNEEIPTGELLAACEELGLKEGARRSDLDQEELRTRLALKFDNIAWASVNIEGVRATVNISESAPSKKDPLEPCNLVAAHDGVITAIEVTSGTISVEVGQTVRQGDLLVSGITEYKDGTYRFGVSAGSVTAETVRELTCFVPFAQAETMRVGAPETRRVLSVFGLKIPLYLGSVGGDYETETETHRLESNGMYLPVTLTETLFYKTQTRHFTLTEAEARQRAEAELSKIEEIELKDAEILSRKVEFEVNSDGVRIKGEYKCRENIAMTDLLLIYVEK